MYIIDSPSKERANVGNSIGLASPHTALETSYLIPRPLPMEGGLSRKHWSVYDSPVYITIPQILGMALSTTLSPFDGFSRGIAERSTMHGLEPEIQDHILYITTSASL